MEEQEKKTFSAIVGLEDLKEHLQNAISMDKISHAYIINGEKDSGKMMLAEAFAATLLCEQKGKGRLHGMPFLPAGGGQKQSGYHLYYP